MLESIDEELLGVKALLEDCTEARITSIFPHFLSLIIFKTPFRYANVKIHLTEKYGLSTSNTVLSLEVTSRNLNSSVISKLTKIALNDASKHFYGKVYAIVDSIKNSILSNSLLPVALELPEVRKLVGKANLKLNEVKGTIRIAFIRDRYFVNFMFTIPTEYPVERLSYKVRSTNYSEHLVNIVGARIDKVLAVIVNIQASEEPNSVLDQAEPMRAELGRLKHDLRYLEYQNELRSNVVDKKSRRMLKRTALREAKQDAEFEERIAAFNEVDVSVSEEYAKTLLPVVRKIIDFQNDIATCTCQVCNELIFSEDPEFAYEQAMKPEQVYCGHWLHYECVHAILTNPPFTAECLTCGKNISHPKFDNDIRKLEKHWAAKSARQRELDEAADFLGF